MDSFAMRNALSISIVVLMTLGGCAGPMAVDRAIKKLFQVPALCDADMNIHENIAPCVRALLPLGKRYGEVALQKLDAVQSRVPKDKVLQADETRVIIQETCLGAGRPTRVLYDSGMTDVASERGSEVLMKCFFYAGRILKNFGAGQQGKKLSVAAARAFWGLYRDDDYLIPPPGLFLGAR